MEAIACSQSSVNMVKDQYHIFIQYKTEWLNGQQRQIQLDIYVIELLVNRMNELVDLLEPRNNDLNNMNTKRFYTNTFLT
jgi:hypothetical protein